MSRAEEFNAPDTLVRRMQGLAVAGLLAFAIGAFLSPPRAWTMLLLASYYAAGLALGGALFVAFQTLTGASWSIAIRRVPEAMAMLLPLGGAGLLIVAFVHPDIYPWSRAAIHDAMPAFRKMWLALPFFRLRAIVYLAGWSAFVIAIVRRSRARSGSSVALSAMFVVFFGITFTLASSDWIMSLEPDWASTIFGMYNFAGLFVSALAALTIVTVWLDGRGLLAHVGKDRLHDLGKLLFAFSTFWMYLWFSQYMLIWYANLSEESVYFIRRTEGLWQPLFFLNLALNWVLPFFALLPKVNKQRPGVLVKVSIVLLLGRWLDLYLMIAPPVVGSQPKIGLWEIVMTAGAVGAFAWMLFGALRAAPLVSRREPALEPVAEAAPQ